MDVLPSPWTLSIAPTLASCKRVLTDHYGARLQALILFGSAARQELSAASDIDLLVVLNAPFSHGQELRTLVDLLYPLQFEASHWISAKPAEQAEFESGALQLYRNVQAEGLPL
jgi:predicted nucleotidyltransferase